MKKHFNLNLKLVKYGNKKKGISITGEILVLFLILISSLVVIDNGITGQNNSTVQNSSLSQSSGNQSPKLAPINSEFTNDQQNNLFTVNAQSLNGSLNGHEKGLVPSTVDLQNLDHASSAFKSLSTPLVFDLRSSDRVTPVKDQGNAGSCWAFATYGSMESYFKPSESMDFSENNLKNVLSSASSEGFDFVEGGNMYMSTAYLARWGGPIKESDDPYSDSSSSSPTGLTVQKHAQDIIYLADRQNSQDNAEIKTTLQTYGAIYTSMCYEDSCFSYRNSSYYYNGNSNSNHAVTIVGWNDSYDKNKFIKVPAGNGAFIVKNSWGTGWGDNGYFYVSYYDKRIGTENAVFKAESASNYNTIYQYDPLGWVRDYGFNSNTAWGANIFTAKSGEVLKAVSFYTTDENCDYEIYIYTNPQSNPINQASLALTQSGTITNAGYHTVGLNSDVSLSAGQKFSVVVKLTTSGYEFPVAIEYPYSGYSSKAKANAGESYVSADGQSWTDITTEYRNTNICIKAFTNLANGALPAASFSATPLSGTAPLQVNFTDTSTGSPISWNWNFGDGTNSTEQNPAHIYSVKGNYTISFIVTNNAGNDTETKSKYVVVTAPQPPVASFSSNTKSGSLPLSVTFTDTSTRSPASWYWDFGDRTNSREQNPIHVYNKVGRFTVTLKASNNAGSSTLRKTNFITVTAPQPPVASFSSNVKSGSMPLSVTFTDTSSRLPTSWYWDFGDGTNSNGQNPVHVYTKAGKYTVSLKASNAAGSNTAKKTSYITVTAPKPPTSAFTANKVSGKVPLTVTFTDKSTGSPTSWSWNFGDGTPHSTVRNPTHTFTKIGKYTVSLTTTNANGSHTITKKSYITVSK
jgi:PKD repeat protein